VESLVNEYKNVRSWLEALILYLKSPGITTIGMTTLSGEDMAIYPYQLSTIEGRPSARFIGAYGRDVETITINPPEV
jgi:P2-related tail formation protein